VGGGVHGVTFEVLRIKEGEIWASEKIFEFYRLETVYSLHV